MCCELLSEVSIFDIRNNDFQLCNKLILVVNCFQKLVSLIFGTTVTQNVVVDFGL